MLISSQRPFVTGLILFGLAACGTSSSSTEQIQQFEDSQDAPETTQQLNDIETSDSNSIPDEDVNDPWKQYNTAPVTEPGPHRIGYRVETIQYTPMQTDEDRELRVALWYPTEDSSGEPASFNFGLFPVERAEVFSNATPLENTGPVMVYSHGNFGFAEAHYNLAEHFASHGFTVIAPDHTGNTWNSFSERDTDTYLNRPQDLSACLDAFAPSAEQVVVVGHSYGGYTGLSIAGATPDLADCENTDNTSDFCSLLDDARRDAFGKLSDPRIDLIVPMAAGNSSNIEGDGDGVSNIAIPVFLLTGSLDISNSNTTDGDPYWAALDGANDRRLNIINGGHQSFASTCIHYEVGLEDGDGCTGDEFIKPADAIAIINEYVLAFARLHLTNDTAQLDRLNGLNLPTNIELSSKN